MGVEAAQRGSRLVSESVAERQLAGREEKDSAEPLGEVTVPWPSHFQSSSAIDGSF